MSYRVLLMPEPRAAIREQARYLAEDQHAPLTAERWLRRVLAAVDGLEAMPRSGSIAPESELVSYEIRMRLVGNFLLLYHIDEPHRVVRVIGFRHGARLPRPENLSEPPNV